MAQHPSLKLTYFDLAGRAELTRLALTIGDIPFEDDRVPRDQWPALKPTLPFRQMPVLTVDGQVITQSGAIARYAGALAGLYPTATPLDAARVDEILFFTDDILNVVIATFRIADEAARKAERETLSTTKLPEMFGLLDARLAANAKGTWYLDHLTLADLAIYLIVASVKSGWIDGIATTVADAFPKVAATYEAVHTHPKVAEWNAKHAPAQT
ncbi:Aste57867_689 [Aphanomyces stellatus]|uniref:Aste57867_689 protein n=1 Tax=Aphanomyces stellatus TaxID=120398 RepID=A0A485K387_9STRA|nr:hypothetical protein As57867_000688 [Aphanomyces stellatus]VFT77914.1 Aste57867_689 [Aphanomyces stellatus]